MPSRAARWISAMTWRSKRYDSRSSQGWCVSSVAISAPPGDVAALLAREKRARHGRREPAYRNQIRGRPRTKPGDALQPPGARMTLPGGALVGAGVVDVEVVEPPGGAVAAEIARIGVVDAGAPEEVGELGAMLVAKLLLDAVGAETGDLAADVDARLVDRVSERLAGVPADDEATRLRHERAQMPDGAAHDDIH